MIESTGKIILESIETREKRKCGKLRRWGELRRKQDLNKSAQRHRKPEAPKKKWETGKVLKKTLLSVAVLVGNIARFEW